MADTLNQARRSGLDFKTISDDLLARIQVQFAADFNDFAVSSMSIVLLDVVSFGLDTLSFYLDRRASDNYLSTARTRSAISKLTRALGYKMGGAVAASVLIQINTQSVYSFQVTVPKGFQFQGPSGLVFEAGQDTVIPANTPITTLFTIPCYQGTTLSESFTADSAAAPNQIFQLRKIDPNSFVVFGTVNVIVDGSSWNENSLLTYEATNQFEIDYNGNPPTVRFGDGDAGNIPLNSASIVVSYVSSSGKNGAASKGTITSAVQTLVVNFTSINLTITNPSAVSPGDDPETTASAQAQAPQIFKSRRVAVTQGDYETLASTYADPLYGRVTKAKAYLTRTAATDLALQTSIQTITSAVTNPVIPVQNAVVALNSTLDDIVIQSSNLIATANEIQNLTGSIDTALLSSIVSNTTDKAVASEVVSNATNITTLAGPSGTAATILNSIGFVSGPDNLSAATKSQLAACLASVVNSAALAIANANSLISNLTTTLSNLNSARSTLASVGTPATRSLSTSLLFNLDAATSEMESDISQTEVFSEAISTQTTGAYNSVIPSLTDIQNHFQTVLSNESQTNLVTVPILALDASGFYTAPSAALVKSLQTFLNTVKDITHTVVVISGATFLLPAVVSARIGISKTATQTQSQIQTAVASVIDSELKGRDPSVSLYLSDFDDLKKLAGIVFCNISIAGYLGSDGVTVLTDKTDQSGNLVAPSGYAVTKGTVTISVEVAP